MTHVRIRLVCAMLLFICLALCAVAQPGDCRADIKTRVLNLLFPSANLTSPYLTKMTLRFSDSNSQLVILTYPVYPVNPEGRVEVVSYSITGMGNRSLSEIISSMLDKNPNVTDQEIASKLKVKISRSPIEFEAFQHALKQLKHVQISPVLASRVAVDEYSTYEFWYDGGQESVHYTLTGPSNDAPQDKLVQWMIKFRASLPTLTKSSHHG